MTPSDLLHFRRRYKLSKAATATALGCSSRAYYNYEAGISKIPGSIDLASSAVALGLKPYSELKELLKDKK